MTDRYTCPSPDDCKFATDEVTELTEHINTEHAGEYQREEWPDTPAGRAARSKHNRGAEDGDEDEEADRDE